MRLRTVTRVQEFKNILYPYQNKRAHITDIHTHIHTQTMYTARMSSKNELQLEASYTSSFSLHALVA